MTTPDHRETTRGMWFVYLLRCADTSLYCGITNDLARRLAAHSQGRVKYTRSRLPVAYAWQETAADRSAASRREWQIKRLPRDKKLSLLTGESMVS